jgi:DNA-binding transcriptional ArsR family regulator
VDESRTNPVASRQPIGANPIVAKWGRRILAPGFLVLPVAILDGQREMELDAVDLAILVHLFRHWWERENLPHPSKERLARALGMQPRSIQRRLARLERLHLVSRHPRRDPKTGRNLSCSYGFEGLLARAESIADALIAQRKSNERIKTTRKT